MDGGCGRRAHGSGIKAFFLISTRSIHTFVHNQDGAATGIPSQAARTTRLTVQADKNAVCWCAYLMQQCQEPWLSRRPPIGHGAAPRQQRDEASEEAGQSLPGGPLVLVRPSSSSSSVAAIHRSPVGPSGGGLLLLLAGGSERRRERLGDPAEAVDELRREAGQALRVCVGGWGGKGVVHDVEESSTTG